MEISSKFAHLDFKSKQTNLKPLMFQLLEIKFMKKGSHLLLVGKQPFRELMSHSTVCALLLIVGLAHNARSQEVKPKEEQKPIPITRIVASLVDQFKNAKDANDRVRTIQQFVDQKELATPALPTLAKAALEDTSFDVRIAAVEAFGKLAIGSPVAIEALIQILDEDNPRFIAEAAVSLGKIGPVAESAIPKLIEKLNHKSSSARMGVLFALGKIAEDPEAVLEALTKSLEDPDYQCRYSAMMTLEKYGPKAKEAAPALLAYVERGERSPRTKIMLLKALIKVGQDNPKVTQAVIDQIKSAQTPRDRSAILHLLGSLEEQAKTFLPELIKLQDSFEAPGDKAAISRTIQRIQASKKQSPAEAQTDSKLPEN